jgi:hypothetical protein
MLLSNSVCMGGVPRMYAAYDNNSNCDFQWNGIKNSLNLHFGPVLSHGKLPSWRHDF